MSKVRKFFAWLWLSIIGLIALAMLITVIIQVPVLKYVIGVMLAYVITMLSIAEITK